MTIKHKKMALMSRWTVTELMSMLFDDKQKHSETYQDVLDFIKTDMSRLWIDPNPEKLLVQLADPETDIEKIHIQIRAEATKDYLHEKIFGYMLDNNIRPANTILNVVALMDDIDPKDVLSEWEYEDEGDYEEECESESEKSPFLPLPPGTTWDQVKITLVTATDVLIDFEGRCENHKYNQMGMKDNRLKSGDRPREMIWKFFILLLKEQGVVSDTSPLIPPGKQKELNDILKEFRDIMKKTFGIDENPLHRYSKKQYRSKFKASDNTQTSIENVYGNLDFTWPED